MARGINKVILIGNLGRDPEVRYTSNGSAVANITIATSEKWKDRQTGQDQERTEWHRVVLFGKLGEIAGEYLKKGQQVYVEGRLQTRKWQDQGGQDRYSTEIVASDMQMLGGPRTGGSADFNQDYGSQDSGDYGGQPSRGGQRPAARSGGSTPPPSGGNFDDFDDDIPF